jgi:hypothetical protein
MSGVETISDESEVGFNQAFASNRFRAEQAGRVAKVRSTPAPGPGPRDGPFGHELGQSPDRARAVYDGPIAHHGSGTTLLVHIRQRQDVPNPVELGVNQQIIGPMGYQRSIPLANSTSPSNCDERLAFGKPARHSDALVRSELTHNAVGLIPLRLGDSANTVNWAILVVQ